MDGIAGLDPAIHTVFSASTTGSSPVVTGNGALARMMLGDAIHLLPHRLGIGVDVATTVGRISEA